MKKVTEKKYGKKSYFIVETVIADQVISEKNVNVQIDIVEYKGKDFCLFYDSDFNKDLSNWNILDYCDTNMMFSGCPIKEKFKPKSLQK